MVSTHHSTAIAREDSLALLSDDELHSLPTYTELYSRWEQQFWSVHSLSLLEDRKHWLEADDSLKAKILSIGGFAGFFHLETTVTGALAPFVTAMPLEEQRRYLATQIADEAKHALLFERLYTEVLELSGDMENKLNQTRQWTSPALKELDRRLGEAAQRISKSPTCVRTLVHGVTLCHLLSEATLGLGCQYMALKAFRALGAFPGLCEGILGLLRDEIRHVSFGVRFLRETAEADPAVHSWIAACLDENLPYVVRILTNTLRSKHVYESLCIDVLDRLRFGLFSLERKLAIIGTNYDLGSARWLEIP